jgi:hypothetical protein
VVEASTLPLHGVLVIADIFSVTVPANTSRTVGFLCRIQERLLSLVVGAIRLDQINDVELIADVLASVRHSKVEPLRVGRRLVVVLEDQVVSIIAHVDCPAQVSGLKPRLEN